MSDVYWTIIRHRIVTEYLIPTDTELRIMRRSLRQAIQSLQNGIPEDAELINEVTQAYRWQAENHHIRFTADSYRRLIYVTIIEPYFSET